MRAWWVGVTTAVLSLSMSASAQAEPVIPVGAKAAGLDIGGLTLSDAADRLAGAFSFPLGQPIEVRVARHRRVLRPADIGFYFDPYKTARRANIAAKAATVEEDGDHDVDVPLHVTYDRDALAAFTVRVDRGSDVTPRNAHVRFKLNRMVLRRARMGWSIDERALADRLDPLLADPYATRLVRASRSRVPPAVNANDLRRRYRVVVTIDRRHFKLRYFRNLKHRKTYGVAVGTKDYPTPTGRYTIVAKAKNPDWNAPDEPWAGAYRNEVIEGGAADNPLKARWLGIVGGVGIHGTAAEDSIGGRASHGCIRMRVSDVIDLYPRVPVGSTVLIR
jgi:lipoprotein-anchoring transpeptidase ErfK/SrfK